MIIESKKTIQNVVMQPDYPVLAEAETQPEVSFAELKTRILTRLLKSYPGLFDFVDENLGLSSFDLFESEAGTFPSISSLQGLEKDSLQSFINLYRFNDFRHLNKYLLEVHEKLMQGGIFIGRGDTLETHNRKFLKTYPPYLSKALYLFHFIYFRAMAKLPLLKKIYFMISRGKNRAISKAEILGRLYFCGFKVLAVEETDENFYFIAKKHTSPSTNKNPSYNLIIKLKRVGLDGRPIFIRKFRTMHPYSEYLQEYVFEHNRLQSNGKFNDDFRITGWGKFMRKYWFDELPQFINYFRGDINLVGVRALSEHYLSLYPIDLKQLRKGFKPGLIPPYYADLPGTFDEIIESERGYFAARMKHGYLTDDRYLCKALFNILLKKARSV